METTHLVESKKTHVVVFSGSLNWLISRSRSEADVLPSSPADGKINRHHLLTLKQLLLELKIRTVLSL